MFKIGDRVRIVQASAFVGSGVYVGEVRTIATYDRVMYYLYPPTPAGDVDNAGWFARRLKLVEGVTDVDMPGPKGRLP